MRTFGTIVLGFFFLLVFDACFFVHSVGGYPLDAAAVTDTMREAEMYDAVLEGIDLAVVQSIEESDNPDLAEEVGGGLGKALKKSMSEEWFYETFEKGYEGFVAYLEGSDKEYEIDLSEQKEALEEYLEDVADKYGKGDKNAKKDVKKALDVMPEKATVAELIQDSGDLDEDKLKELRETISTFNTIRIVMLVIALFFLGLILLVAKKTTKRLLISVGAVLLLSSLTFLATANAAGAAFWSAVEADLDKPDKNDPVDKFVSKKVTKLFEVGMGHAFGRSNLPVGGLAGLGLLLIVGGFVMGGKKAQPAMAGAMPGQGVPPQQPYAPPGVPQQQMAQQPMHGQPMPGQPVPGQPPQGGGWGPQGGQPPPGGQMPPGGQPPPGAGG